MHYPTVADPLEAVWKDDHGSISGRSARKGANVYTDQAGACASSTWPPPLLCNLIVAADLLKDAETSSAGSASRWRRHRLSIAET